MKLGRFSVYSLLGSLPWSFGLTYGGFVLGRNWEKLADNVEIAAVVVAVVIVVGVGVLVLRMRRRSRAKTA
jgi:membrane protein DedA with SNARE-associated domain